MRRLKWAKTYIEIGFIIGLIVAAIGTVFKFIVHTTWTLRIFYVLGLDMGEGCILTGAVIFIAMSLYGLIDYSRYK